MTWSVDSVLTVANLMSTITTRLTAAGWTNADPGYGVFTSTNDQGAANCVQITNCQTSAAAADSTHNRYLQFQGWRSWNAGTHAGTDGSGTTYWRLYYAAADVADTLAGDLYMSVTANRAIIVFCPTNGYRNWAYFGGLDSYAGTNDPLCVMLMTSYALPAATGSGIHATILGATVSATLWSTTSIFPGGQPGIVTYAALETAVATMISTIVLPNNLLNFPGQVLLFPILMYESLTLGAQPVGVRGCPDGLLFCPTVNSTVGHLDTVVVAGITYLIVVPGGAGSGAASTGHPITGNYGQALAIAEV